jgi:hypothetical protein
LKKKERRKTLYIKKQGWEPIHKKYKANKSTKTQASKEHNNQDTTNTQIKLENTACEREKGPSL